MQLKGDTTSESPYMTLLKRASATPKSTEDWGRSMTEMDLKSAQELESLKMDMSTSAKDHSLKADLAPGVNYYLGYMAKNARESAKKTPEERQADISEAAMGMASTKKYEALVGGLNPLKLSVKDLGQALFNNAEYTVFPQTRDKVFLAAKDKRNALMSAILEDAGKSSDPITAAENLLKLKKLDTQVSANAKHNAGSGLFDRANNTISVGVDNRTVLSNKDAVGGTLLHEIQHAEDFKNDPIGLYNITPTVYPVPRKLTNENLSAYEVLPKAQHLAAGKNIPPEKTRERALLSYINRDRLDKGKLPITPGEFEKNKYNIVRAANTIQPDIALLDEYEYANHFLVPRGELSLAVGQGTQHGVFPTKGVNVHPQWEELYKKYLDEQAASRKGSFFDLFKKGK